MEVSWQMMRIITIWMAPPLVNMRTVRLNRGSFYVSSNYTLTKFLASFFMHTIFPDTHIHLNAPHPVRNPELGFFLSGSWDWFVFGAQEQLRSDDLSDTTINLIIFIKSMDTTNDSEGFWTQESLTMSHKRYPLSHGWYWQSLKAIMPMLSLSRYLAGGQCFNLTGCWQLLPGGLFLFMAYFV